MSALDIFQNSQGNETYTDNFKMKKTLFTKMEKLCQLQMKCIRFLDQVLGLVP